ncbi:PH domain-containing protein [Arthrobacter sp. HLT1-21]
MSSPSNAANPVVFTPRFGKWFAGLTWVLAAIGIVLSVVGDGVEGLLSAWPLLALAYFGWLLFWYPSVVIDDDAVTLNNPLRSVSVPWTALIHVDTKFALTLVTVRGSHTAWAAPAPGVWGTHRGKPEHVQGLPESSYGPAQSIRPGDLKNTDSGAAAFLVRTHWASLIEDNLLDVDATETTAVSTRFHWLAIGCAVVLVAANVIAFSVV